MQTGITTDTVTEARALLRASGVPLSTKELRNITVLDYGLGDVRTEGLQNITLLRTARLEVKVQVLLADQSVPQHVHLPYAGNPGKEETIRVLWGTLRLYRNGPDTLREGCIPPGKERYYSLRNETVLRSGNQTTIAPGEWHWFQGGNNGVVAMSFYTRADNSHNRYADPSAYFSVCMRTMKSVVERCHESGQNR
ncbi:MAG: D-lyxose/D-mannose family sugar isomerase [Chitinivibrionales bacterium]|nr:D-lyxose/D-mannose family sugar isomerase [Chitinivibrionales bacterium]